MTTDLTVTALLKVLADAVVLYAKTKNYHWNVEGANFHSLHLLFEEQYNDIDDAIDEIAERVRTFGAKVPADMKTAGITTDIRAGNELQSANEMLQELHDDQQIIVGTLTECLNIAQEVADEATVDMMVERIKAHQKHAWMLKSSIAV